MFRMCAARATNGRPYVHRWKCDRIRREGGHCRPTIPPSKIEDFNTSLYTREAFSVAAGNAKTPLDALNVSFCIVRHDCFS